uniref:Caspase-1 n=2 Tax=Lygus hesperus TaxID=30085 RepID=A0A0A9W4I7_LYGHE
MPNTLQKTEDDEDGPCLSTGSKRKPKKTMAEEEVDNLEPICEPVAKDETEYNMSHEGGRGYAIILFHTKFQNPEIYPERNFKTKTIYDTNEKTDAEHMIDVYRALGFRHIEVFENLERHQITRLVDKLLRPVSKIYNFDDKDCLSITISSYSDREASGRFQTYDESILFTDLWQSLSSDKIPSLGSKPKIFFYDCSRGSATDPGALLEKDDDKTPTSRTLAQQDEIDPKDMKLTYKKQYKLPRMADFFLAYSSAKGHRSYNEVQNSPFIEELKHVFIENQRKEDDQKDDLLSLMTVVTRQMATMYTDPLEGNKQCPSCTSTLIRKVYFRGNGALEDECTINFVTSDEFESYFRDKLKVDPR